MKKAIEQNIKVKIATSLNILLEKRKNMSPEEINVLDLGDSYNTIALNSEMRKATVSDVFNGVSVPNSTTLIMIIEGMGYNLYDFAKVYCTIKEEEIKKYQKKSR